MFPGIRAGNQSPVKTPCRCNLQMCKYTHTHILVSVQYFSTAVPVAHSDGEKNTMGSLSFYEFLFFRPLCPASSFAHVDTYGNGIAKKRSKGALPLPLLPGPGRRRCGQVKWVI